MPVTTAADPPHAALYVEAWPAGWRALADPYALAPLETAEVRALLARTSAVMRAQADRARSGAWPVSPDRTTLRGGVLSALAARLDSLVRAHRGGAFVRLGSRSAKDVLWAAVPGPDALRVTDGAGAVALLAGGSVRVLHDLRAALAAEYAPHVVVRAWQPSPAWAELRCFVRDRRLVGVTAGRGLGGGWPADVPLDAARAAVEALVARFVAVSPLPDAVPEVVLRRDAAGALRAWLLDVNPFAPATDPGHFSWAGGGDFDGSFRVG